MSAPLLSASVPRPRVPEPNGEGDQITLTLSWSYAEALYKADDATLDDLREAVTTLEDAERTARRVLGGRASDHNGN